MDHILLSSEPPHLRHLEVSKFRDLLGGLLVKSYMTSEELNLNHRFKSSRIWTLDLSSENAKVTLSLVFDSGFLLMKSF